MIYHYHMGMNELDSWLTNLHIICPGEAIIGLRDGVSPEKIHGFTEKQQLVA